MKQGTFAAIILAGGLSTRMNRFKPLLPLNDSTLIDHIIDTYQQDRIEVIVVGGYRRDELFAAVTSRNVTFVENPDYELGMFSSVVTGVRSLGNRNQAFFIQPADIPLVRPATVRLLIKSSLDNPDSIIYPAFRGRRGHPPLIPARLIPDILSWNGENGLKGVLDIRGGSAVNIAVPDAGTVMDCDTPDDYHTLREYYSRSDIPTEEEYQAIFDISNMAQDRIIHGQAVANVALAIAGELQRAGHQLDTGIVQASALLHDIAKGKPRHDIAGGTMLHEMGFKRIADVVGLHTDLGGKPVTEPPLETKVVYLADKFVKGGRVIPLEDRYRISKVQYAKDANIETHIRQRKERARQVKQDLEQRIGRPLEEFLVFSEPE